MWQLSPLTVSLSDVVYDGRVLFRACDGHQRAAELGAVGAGVIPRHGSGDDLVTPRLVAPNGREPIWTSCSTSSINYLILPPFC